MSSSQGPETRQPGFEEVARRFQADFFLSTAPQQKKPSGELTLIATWQKLEDFPQHSRIFVIYLLPHATFIIGALICFPVKKQKLSDWVGKRRLEMETLEYTMWELGIDNLFFSAFRHDPYIAWMFFISFKSYFILFLLHISQLVQYFDASVYK